MSKPSLPQFRMPAVWITALAVVAIAVAGLAVKFSALPAKDATAPNPTSNTAEQRGRIRANLVALPLAFEANQGQTDPQVNYMARGNGYSVFLTSTDTVFAISSAKHSTAQLSRSMLARPRPQTTEKVQNASIDMRLVGGNSKPEIAVGNELPGIVNYYVGSDPKNWHTAVKQYSTVSYRDVYPGVNMVFHGAQRQLEFDFVVSPGADPKAIVLGFKGARTLNTDASGNLVLTSSAGDVVLHKPVAYQEKDGKRETVEAAFQVRDGDEVELSLGVYDRGRELVVDPTLIYSSYLGGSAEDDALAVAVDGSGNAYITGETKSPTFPGGGVNPGANFAVFVTEVNAAGNALVYTDIFAATGSGSGDCTGNAIAVDAAGEAFVGGSATVGFPASGGQTTFGGGSFDGFVLKLAANTGAVGYSTYLGGNGVDIVNGIAVDMATPPNAYVAGETASTDFPGTSSSTIQPSNAGADDAFVTKLNGTGTALVYSTYLGGSNEDLGTGIALDSSGNAYVTGITVSTNFPTTSGVFQKTAGGFDDSFVAEIESGGTTLVYATYLGGSLSDDAVGIAVDSAGDAYVTGSTGSINFPTANAAQNALGGNSATNAFVTKLNPGATTLLFSTYYGGALDDSATGITLDSLGDAYITGQATSPTFPVVNSFQSALSGSADAFVSEFNNTGSVVYSSFYGGTGIENAFPGTSAALGGIAVDANDNAYIVGNTNSTTGLQVVGGVQTTYAGGMADGFLAKIGAAPADFSVVVSPSSTSVPSGSTTSPITVTVSSLNSSYGQAVNLSCSGLPSKAVCHFTNASVTPGSSAATSTLTIATNGASSANVHLPSGSRRTQIVAGVLLPILGITLLGVATTRRKKRLYGLLVLWLLLAGLILLPACGGSSGGGGGGTCTTAPSVPTGLAASSTTSSGTTLSWTASTAGANCSVSTYTIYQNGTQIGTSPTPTFNVTGLTASTTYSFTVSASDSAGASAQSSPLSVTTGSVTGGGTPPGTYTITVTGTGANSVSHSAQVTLTVN